MNSSVIETRIIYISTIIVLFPYILVADQDTSTFFLQKTDGAAIKQQIDDPLNGAFADIFDFNDDGFDDLITVYSKNGRFLEFRPGSEEGLILDGVREAISTFQSIEVGSLQKNDPVKIIIGFQDKLEIWEVTKGGVLMNAGEVTLPGTPRSMELVEWKEESVTKFLSARLLHSEGRYIVSLFDISFTPLSINENWSFTTPFRTTGARALDLDKDGWTEVLFVSPGGVRIARGSESGPIIYSDIESGISVQSLTSADIDKDGACEVFAGFDIIYQLDLSPDGEWSRTFLFGESQLSASALQSADLDGDEYPEIIATTRNGFKFFKNNKGVLQLPPESIPGGLEELLIIDFDNDGHLDLVSISSDNIYINFGNSGGQPSRPKFLAPIQRMTAGDINMDGHTDLIYEPSNGFSTPGQPEIAIQVTREDGSFKDPDFIPYPGNSHQLRLVDIDENGTVDLIGTSTSQSGVYMFSGQGNGIFALPRHLSDITEDSVHLAIADVDGDEMPDIVAGERFSGILYYPGNTNIFNETPSPVFITNDNDLRALAIFDVNGDGNLDVAWRQSSPNQINVHPGLGNGTFNFPQVLPLEVNPDASIYRDINDDEYLDSVRSSNGRVTLLLGNGSFSYDEIILFEDQAQFIPMGILDVDNDGQMDLIGNGERNTITLYRGLGNAQFESARIFSGTLLYTFDFEVEAPNLIIGEPPGNPEDGLDFSSTEGSPLASTRVYHTDRIQAISGGDIDGEGTTEIVGFFSEALELRIFRVTETRSLELVGSFSIADLIDDETPVISLRVHDVDGDTNDDIVLLFHENVYMYHSLGNMSFDERVILVEGAPGYNISFHHIDDDEIEDLLIHGFYFARGLGGGQFELTHSYRSGGGNIHQDAVGDFNDDGNIDIAHAFSSSESHLLFSYGDGNGSFEAYESLDSAPLLPGALALGDFNGDGLLDIVHGSEENNEGFPRIWYNQVDASFLRGPDLESPAGTMEGTLALEVADVNRDGIDDLLSHDTQNNILLYLGNRSGLCSASLITSGTRNLHFLVSGNIGGDAATDLVFSGDDGVFQVIGTLDETPKPNKNQIFGDCNQDGEINIADALCIFGVLFIGTPSKFPCGDGTAGHQGNIDMLDRSLSSTMVNISAGTSLLRILFLQSPSPGSIEEQPTCILIPDCPENPNCQ